MPIRYDPTRIRKRYCPRGHDKFVVGVITSNGVCTECNKIIHKKSDTKRYQEGKTWMQRNYSRHLAFKRISDNRKRILQRRERVKQRIVELETMLKENIRESVRP